MKPKSSNLVGHIRALPYNGKKKKKKKAMPHWQYQVSHSHFEICMTEVNNRIDLTGHY